MNFCRVSGFISTIKKHDRPITGLTLPEEEILAAYKTRDTAGKFIRDLKEGAGMRPVRHGSRYAVIGDVLIVSLTRCPE